MYINPNETGVTTRVTGTAATVLLSGPISLLGFTAATVTAQSTLTVYAGITATGTLVGPYTCTTGQFNRLPLYSGTGLTIKLGGTELPDVTLYWNPAD